MHSLWLFFLRKREFSVLLMLALIALGIYAVVLIPKESSPEIIIPIGIVVTVYPGASASDIEELVTNKLEDSIENVDGIDKLTSTSRDGVSLVTAEFNAKADIDKSIQLLKDAVDKAKGDLPTDALDPTVTEVNFADQPIDVIAVSSDLSPAAFTALGEQLKTEFKSVSGVSKVEVTGTRPRQIQVVVKEEALRAYGLGINSVTSAITQGNLSLPVGVVETAGIEYSIRFEGKLETAEEIMNLPVGTKAGVPVYIRDIATVNDSVDKESTISRVSVGGKPSESSMTLSVYKKSGLDVTKVTAATLAKLADLQKPGQLLNGSQVLVVFDQGDKVHKDLSDLVEAGGETVLLVILCLLLTIGWRESVVAALSIPLSFTIAFIGLYASGNTINFISLFALILAVGILVDSGIVITEAIHTRIRKFGDASTAAENAIREYAWPLIAGTMTTIAVFAPLFFLSGVTGKFIAGIPFTIIFVLLASIFVALGMVPLIAIYLTSNSHSNRFEELQEHYTEVAQAWYRSHIVTFLKNKVWQRILLWSLFIGFVGALFMPILGLMNVEFFPGEDSDSIYVSIETAQGTPVTETDLSVRAVEEVLYDQKDIVSFTTTAGAGSAFTGSTDAGGKYGNITVSLKPKAERTETSDQLSAKLRTEFAKIKNATIAITAAQNGPPTGAPVFIKFTGESLDDLLIASDNAERLLSSIPGTRDVDASSKSNATEFVLSVDRAKASALGVSPALIGGVLRSAAFGAKATTINRNGEDIDIMVKLGLDKTTTDVSATPRITIDALRNIEVPTMNGGTVPLSNLVIEKLAPANAAIAHEDKKRLVTVQSYMNDGITSASIVNTFKSRIGELKLPAGITVAYGGEAENVNQSFAEMGIALIVGLILMLSILVLSFNSIRYSLYLLLAVPYSLIGVLFGLTATGLALSFTSLLGVIALAGVIINHAIILMDSLITHKASVGVQNESLVDQVADAAVSRFRPIILTTITTVVGMIPLSRISDLWSPLAYAIMFGLSFAMILTLVLVPTLYYRNETHKIEKAAGKFKNQTWFQWFYSYMPWSRLE